MTGTWAWGEWTYRVTLQDDGTHLAECGKHDWQRIYPTHTGAVRMAERHYRACHRDMPSTEGED